MILIVGASGRLGGMVARALLGAGKPVRAMSRTPEKLEELRALGAEVVAGDLRDAASLERACAGATRVLAAAHAFESNGSNVPRTVDGAGNEHLIDAARAAGVDHFVLTSIIGARADHPVDLWREKFHAEQHLRAVGLSYTILRPTAFMELWSALIGAPIVREGKAIVFGRGVNPINFVAASDVARFAVMALENPEARNRVIAVGGPTNVSLLGMVEMIERAAGRTASKQHIPLAMMRLLSVAARPINATFARRCATGVLMDTTDMTFDPGPTLRAFPLELTRLEEVVGQRFGSRGRV